jgi:hypothetical protein
MTTQPTTRLATATQSTSASQSTGPLIISARVAKRSTIPSWPWRRGAMLLTGAAVLLAIASLTRSSDPVSATWVPLLLAVAPVPLVAATAFAPARIGRLTGAAAIAAMLAGTIGAIGQSGMQYAVFFLPGLIALIVGTGMLWREPPDAASW